MKINQEAITKKIEDQDYLQDLETVKYSELNKTKIKKFASKMIQEVVQASNHDSLIQTQLAVSGQRPVTFALESNIINLPFANYKKISNFFDDETPVPVNIYFETISDYINVSHFRIDILASVDEIVADAEKFSEILAENIVEKLKEVRSYKKPEPTTKKTAAKKETSK
ncbi:hypothetical protein [Lactobacillus sp. PV012]|uniref:hypothetical protein n=1 Tax=Lactobacillus sp. PV012 TaxID=2594494 RepID=UPI00223FDA2C|nr:hypothetical protein [Lactobacillus sp. PV012]QNQ82789.1 hypothetical protein FP433_06955 [Lactobacillus sp. PV012]